jgi:hypothetical protein
MSDHLGPADVGAQPSLASEASRMEWTADTISQLVLWAFIAAACAYAWHSMRKGWRESEKINRAVDEENRRKAESQEGLAAYWEARRRERNDLKKLILGDLKLIRRGERGLSR